MQAKRIYSNADRRGENPYLAYLNARVPMGRRPIPDVGFIGMLRSMSSIETPSEKCYKEFVGKASYCVNKDGYRIAVRAVLGGRISTDAAMDDRHGRIMTMP